MCKNRVPVIGFKNRVPVIGFKNRVPVIGFSLYSPAKPARVSSAVISTVGHFVEVG
ncbi:hypothetical protein PR003_g26645 [Phytophthora rubi]|uniref:Uncharacterized protein n=1 Tax=Phytophthora rubi TaxID=129364 RepID=A0A6A3I692_9STRA|nr:hypothetical protein PR001_g25790 [Phytophthora rubi]KAE8976405.1 hypothetical protein PR002_g25322 [Phytophthora rubi]KAE9285221.1 hypothetical protein PR003_g26645 [Phytophthora rubi]